MRVNGNIIFPPPGVGEPWPDKHVDWNRPRQGLIKEFKTTLESAKDERPLQDLFRDHPYILAMGVLGGLHGSWVFPKPQLGGKYIPDFLICNWTSNGPSWYVIELESPSANSTTQKGSISARCRKGVEQIMDYRAWLRDHVEHERNMGKYGINGNCSGWVIIGRRDRNRTELAGRRLTDLDWENHIQVASYDRLLETFAFHQRYINGSWKGTRALAREVKRRKNEEKRMA
jgi:hypothetical protein